MLLFSLAAAAAAAAATPLHAEEYELALVHAKAAGDDFAVGMLSAQLRTSIASNKARMIQEEQEQGQQGQQQGGEAVGGGSDLDGSGARDELANRQQQLKDEVERGLLDQWEHATTAAAGTSQGDNDADSAAAAAAVSFGDRTRMVHQAVLEARGNGQRQRGWLRRVQEMYEARGTPIDTVCSICMEDVHIPPRTQQEGTETDSNGGDSDIFFTVCAHVFHAACLEGATVQQQSSGGAAAGLSCPNCRAVIRQPTDVKMHSVAGGGRLAGQTDAVSEALRNDL